MNQDQQIDALTEAIDKILRPRGGELWGRLGWLGLLLKEERAYIAANLPCDRQLFITYFTKVVPALRQRGYKIVVKEFSDPDYPGPYIKSFKP